MLKILIIKLGADGDVLRTLPLAKALKEKYRQSEITWVTKGDVKDLIENLPYIDSVKNIPYSDNYEYDILYNFDFDKEACDLAINAKAKQKYGFYMNDNYPATFNAGAEYYLNTFFDDELKKNNRKTYQEMMFEVAELPYNHENYEIILNKGEKNYAMEFQMKNNIKAEKLIGIHIGASSRWPSKVWDEDKVKDFIIKATRSGYEIILFGGPNEADRHEKFVNELNNSGIMIYRNNPLNRKREFASLICLCRVMVCSDSFALHLSIGLKKPTVGLFFCNAPWEVEDYGLLKKAISPMLNEFFPERMDEYSKKLVNSISAEEVLKLVEEFK